jgi:hypothetical protein
VNAGRDDDALSWSGDDDPTLEVGARSEDDVASSSPGTLPAGYVAVGRGSESIGAENESAPGADATEPSQTVDTRPADGVATDGALRMGNAELISLGVLGGVYALFAIGWLIGGLRLQGRAQYLVFDVMFQGSLWLAVLAPVLWFATTLLLTRASRTWVRFAWLAAGVVLLLPWPFVMVGAVGQ